MYKNLLKQGRTKPLQERSGRGGGGGGGDYPGFKGMGISELRKRSKPGERGEAYFSFSFVQWNPYVTKSSVYNERYFLPQL